MSTKYKTFVIFLSIFISYRVIEIWCITEIFNFQSLPICGVDLPYSKEIKGTGQRSFSYDFIQKSAGLNIFWVLKDTLKWFIL